MDKPKKRETPQIKRFLIEFMLVNCKNDSPTEAAKTKLAIVITRQKKESNSIYNKKA